MAGTVKDFKRMMGRLTGLGNDFSPFIKRSEEHAAFCARLNELGASRIASLPLARVSNIDETVVLSDDEWSNLEQELCRLHRL